MNSFLRRYLTYSVKVERLLFSLAVLLLLLLVIGQTALRSEKLRPYLVPVEILEGVPYLSPGEENRP